LESDTLLPSTTVEVLVRKLFRMVGILRDCGARIEADLVRSTLALTDRWTALLRRWLVEGEIARRQAVRALNRRRHSDNDAPRQSASVGPLSSARAKVDTFADPANDAVPTQRSQRHATPTSKPRTTSPTAAPSPSYAHVKARVSTRRPYEAPACVAPREQQRRDNREEHLSEMEPPEMEPPIVSRAKVDTYADPTNNDAVPTQRSQPIVAATPPLVLSPRTAPLPDLVVISPPRHSPQRALQPRGTNTTALRRIMTLETKIAELEQDRPVTPQRNRRRKVRAGAESATLSFVEPAPRAGVPPVPSTPSTWCLPPGTSNTDATGRRSASAGEPPQTAAPLTEQHKPTSSMMSYLAPSTTTRTPSTAAPVGERSSSTNASVEVAHAILFHPIAQHRLPQQQQPQQWSFPHRAIKSTPDYVSRDVLSYIISSGAQRTPSTASSSTSHSGIGQSSRSSSIQYFARSSSRTAEEDIYHV
jgi:hypothetical protein